MPRVALALLLSLVTLARCASRAGPASTALDERFTMRRGAPSSVPVPQPVDADVVRDDDAGGLAVGAPGEGSAAASPPAPSPAPPAPTVPRLVLRPATDDAPLAVVAEALPARSADGATLLVPETSPGPTQQSALRVLLLDARTGRQRRALVVVSNGESEQLLGEPSAALADTLRARVEALNATLTALGASPLTAGADASEEPCDDCEPDGRGGYLASVAGWTLSSRDGRLRVYRGGAATGRPVAQRALPSMRGAERACRAVNVPRLSAVRAIDPGHLLLRVEYAGHDSCWEGPPVWLVLPVPPS